MINRTYNTGDSFRGRGRNDTYSPRHREDRNTQRIPKEVESRKSKDDRLLSSYLEKKLGTCTSASKIKGCIMNIENDTELRASLSLCDPTKKIPLRACHFNQVLNHLKHLKQEESESESEFLESIFRNLFKALRLSIENPWTISTIMSNLEICHDKSLVRDLLLSLSSQIENCKEPFSSQHIAMCFYGIHGQDPKACSPVIKALETKLSSCKEQFSPYQIAMCFYGIHGQDPRVCSPVIKALEAQLLSCKEQFSRQHIAMCFHGLEGQDEEACTEVTKDLVYKLDKLDRNETLPPNLVSMILGKAKWHLAIIDAENLLTSIKPRLILDQGSEENFSVLRELCLLNYLHHQRNRRTLPSFSELKKFISSKLERESLHTNIKTEEESRVKEIIQKILEDNTAIGQSHLIDGIESDLYVEKLKLRIEVDGKHHLNKAQCDEDQLRDEYLKNTYGIRTIRILNGTKEGEIKEAIQSLLKQAI